jgi:hypothetical protein
MEVGPAVCCDVGKLGAFEPRDGLATLDSGLVARRQEPGFLH